MFAGCAVLDVEGQEGPGQLGAPLQPEGGHRPQRAPPGTSFNTKLMSQRYLEVYSDFLGSSLRSSVPRGDDDPTLYLHVGGT